jgi:hypothetical protein
MSGCTVLVCRACCCGTAKHAGFDHDAQLERIRAAAAGIDGARVRVVGCLDVCSRSNVVVGIVTEASTTALCDWLAAGGPATPRPATLDAHVFLGPHVDVPADLRDEDCDRPRRRLPVASP